ncbi:MAG: PadR family transcriptional regulator, regulatory protein PadR [Actinomycetota bacterium]|jgi:transcriptional regulator|nr:PadR family transcriptional regulator, regulatory protein PadR [Actinomycetota bacterium]
MRGEAIKGHLDMLLLAVLEDGDAHGYAVIEGLRETSNGAFDLPEGTVYPALHRLERERYVASQWNKSSGRKRRVYSLTARGRKALTDRRSEWAGFSRAVGTVIGL